MIRQTSIESYNDIILDGTEISQKLQVLYYIRRFTGVTRNEINRETGITINAVTGRVNKLLEEKAIYEDGFKIDPITKKKNYVLKVLYCYKDGQI